MSLTEISLNIPTEHVANVFGQFDAYIKKIERTLNVTVVVRGDSMKLIGNERQIKSASNVFMQLLELSKRGNVITEQNVNYALSLAAEAKESRSSRSIRTVSVIQSTENRSSQRRLDRRIMWMPSARR